MADTQNLGTLFVNLKANTVDYKAGMSRVNSITKVTAANIAAVMATAAAAAAAAFAAIAAAGVRAFARLEDAMVKSTSIMVSVTEGLQKRMELLARSMSTNTVTSATQLAEAYYFLASAGLSAEQSMAALATVERFAVAGAFDMALATDLLTDAQTALGLAVKDATQNMENMTRVSDVLVKASTLANASVEQFADSLTNKAAVRLAAMNKEVEEGVAVLAAYADAGVKGRLAGERLNILFRDLEIFGNRNEKMWKKLGVSVYAADGELRNIADIVSDLEIRLDGMTDKGRASTLMMLGLGSEAVDALLPLIGVSEKLRQFETQLKDAGGTTQNVAERQLSSFSVQMKIVGNRVTELFTTIGEYLVPVLKVFNEIVGEAWTSSNGFQTAIHTLSKVITFLAKYAIAAVLDRIWHMRLQFRAVKVVLYAIIRDFVLLKDMVVGVFSTIGPKLDQFGLMFEKAAANIEGFVWSTADSAGRMIEKALTPIANMLNKVSSWLSELTGRETNTFKVDVDFSKFEDAIAKNNEWKAQLEEQAKDLSAKSQEAVDNVSKIWKASQEGTSVWAMKTKEAADELEDLWDQGRPSRGFLESVDEAIEKMQTLRAEAVLAGVDFKGMASSIAEVSNTTAKVLNGGGLWGALAAGAELAAEKVINTNSQLDKTVEVAEKKPTGLRNVAKEIVEWTRLHPEEWKKAKQAGYSTLTDLTALMNSENKKQQAIGKAAAIVQTTIDTYKAATGAYSAMANIPYVGPALGAAAAAAAIAAGMANVSAIKSQNYAGAYEQGGIVPGYSYSGDNMIARVNSAEAIFTTPQQRRLLGYAEGKMNRGVPEVTWNLDITNNVGGTATAQIDESTKTISVLIDKVDRGLAGKVKTGSSELATAIDRTRGLRRIGV